MYQLLRSFIITISLLASIALALLGCKPTPHILIIPSYLAMTTHTKDGVQVVQQGSRLLVMLSTDAFFVPPTPELQQIRVPQLMHVAYFVYSYSLLYPYAIVDVRGYTDQLLTPATQRFLSLQYAEVIQSYLWNAGIPMERIRAIGYSSAFPIASQRSVEGMGYNRRVEIQIN